MAGDPIVEPLVGLVIETVSVSATVNELVTVVDPATFEAVTENVCAPTESAGLVCGLVHGLIAVRASHWQVTVVAVPPPRVNVPVAGEATVEPFAGLLIVTVGLSTTLNVFVLVSVPAALDAVTVKVCEPAVSAGLVCGLVHELITGCASHWQVTDDAAPPPRTNVPVTGEPSVAPLAGAVIETVGGAMIVKFALALTDPAALLAVTVKVCDPTVTAFGPCGLVHGLITVSASH